MYPYFFFGRDTVLEDWDTSVWGLFEAVTLEVFQ